jgi:hypothetical protein
MASTSGSAPAESRLLSPITQAMRSVNGINANPAAVTAHEAATIARCAPVRSASTPHAVGATMRASAGSASTQAISTALRLRLAR